MKISINEILKLEVAYNDTGIDSELSTFITGGIYTGYLEDTRIVINDYMRDCVCDNRNRSLSIIFFDGIPTVLYQYIGKGEYQNVHSINKEKTEELKIFMISRYIEEENAELDIISMDEDIEILTYGATCSIEGSNLVAK